MYHAKLGPIDNVSGCGQSASVTTDAEEVLTALMEKLDELKEQLSLSVKPGEETEIVERVGRYDDYLGQLERRIEEGQYFYNDRAEVEADTETLVSLLDEFSPPYSSFESYTADGVYGFWPDFDQLHDCEHEGAVIKVDAGDKWPTLSDDVDAVMEVSDHGNVTLYDRNHNEIWSIV